MTFVQEENGKNRPSTDRVADKKRRKRWNAIDNVLIEHHTDIVPLPSVI